MATDIKFKAQQMGMSPRMINKTDPRRLQELMDARMIQEDEEAMANLPTRAIHREFHHSYNNPYDDNAAIRPIPNRNRKYADNEDLYHYEADLEAESYGAPVRSEW
jgi:hypothetical protein